MKKIIKYTAIFALACLLQQCSYSQNSKDAENMPTKSNESKKNPVYSTTDTSAVKLTDAEWKKILPSSVYEVARLKGTERPFSSIYENFKEKGTYYCAVCGNPLFKSDTKFDSNCGWPSFFEPINKGSLIYQEDNSLGMSRTEVICGRCHSHLGHVFKDGPPPTGLRYCINGVVLNFAKAQKAAANYQNKKKNE